MLAACSGGHDKAFRRSPVCHGFSRGLNGVLLYAIVQLPKLGFVTRSKETDIMVKRSSDLRALTLNGETKIENSYQKMRSTQLKSHGYHGYVVVHP